LDLQRERDSLRVQLAVANRELSDMKQALADADTQWQGRLAALEATLESELARAVAEAQRRQHHAANTSQRAAACASCPRCATASHTTTVDSLPDQVQADARYWQGMYRDSMRQLGRTEGQLRDAQRRAEVAEYRLQRRGTGAPVHADPGLSDIEEIE